MTATYRPLPPLTALLSWTRPTAFVTHKRAATTRSRSSSSERACCSSPRLRFTTASPTCSTCSGCSCGTTSSRRSASRRCGAPRRDVDPATLAAVAARLTVARSRDRVRAGYGRRPLALSFPQRAARERVRAGVGPEPLLLACVAGAERLGAGGPAAPLPRIPLLRRPAARPPPPPPRPP